MAQAEWINPPDSELREILATCRTIAVVGVSAKPERDSHRVAKYLIENGYSVFPVNPALDQVLGQKCYPDLASLPQAVEVVDVFRKPEAVPPIAQEAVRLGAKVLWLQLGVRHDQAAQQARQAGLSVVQDLCIMATRKRLFGGQ